MIAAAETVFKAILLVETTRPIVEKYQRDILAEVNWPVRDEFVRHGIVGAFITDPKDSYLISEENFGTYAKRCDRAREAAGLSVGKEGNCPLLEADYLLVQAKWNLIDSMSSITGVTSKQATAFSLNEYQKFIELHLRLLAPFAKATLP